MTRWGSNPSNTPLSTRAGNKVGSFLNRLRAGYCRYVNPYNTAQQPRVSLLPEDVDGFVFWTKNLAPFLPVLEEVKQREMPFMIQYMIKGYPRELESRVAALFGLVLLGQKEVGS